MQTLPDLHFQRDTAWGITQMAFHCPLSFFLWQNALLLSIPPPSTSPRGSGKTKGRCVKCTLVLWMEWETHSAGRPWTDGKCSRQVKASQHGQSFCLGEGIWPQPKKGGCSFQAPLGTAALNCARLEQTEEEGKSVVGNTIRNRSNKKMIP